MSAFTVGDSVKIIQNDEGYLGQFGVVFAVFPSGRCQVAVGRITVLHLTPEMIIHAVPDRQVGSMCSEEDAIAASDGSTADSTDPV